MNKPLIYLAGGMRSGWQDKVVARCPGADFYDPRSHGSSTPSIYTPIDLFWVRKSDIIFAYAEADNPGLWNMALEIGCAVGCGKEFIYVDERSLKDASFARYAAMLHYTAHSYWTSLDAGIEYLRALLKHKRHTKV